MTDPVKSVQAFTLTLPRETPYLGAARPGEEPNAQGYLVRRGNRTVYPVFDRSVLVRVETRNGVVGWGETYGLVAPGAVGEIIGDLLAGFTIGRDPGDPVAVFDDLYDLMRVRGYTGGFYVDALAAIDIALWDIAGRQAGRSVADLLGGVKHPQIPAYVSGLPENTRARRAALAKSWQEKGFNAFKFATPVADDGPAAEIATLRETLGPQALIAADMHWNQSAEEALALIGAMAPHGLWFAEAPVRTEDIAALARVTEKSLVPVAVGEEWRTHFDMLQRIERCAIAIVQPEMGHKGITSFMRIGRLAEEHGIDVIPHATIGAGIFLAASLQASSALAMTRFHEFQHSIFEPNRRLLEGDMECRAGAYTPPGGVGLGVELSQEALALLKPL
ncbi:MAG: mandelate racemase/muconate lactonizing enzyme family protein [Tropicimonas sp.]|uniref:mandelate racemase/muconate lactonizing enzyme family protein n=1 Tax=Tropicimonas sp. TaxID=2067044 RepID=UPI003A88C13A